MQLFCIASYVLHNTYFKIAKLSTEKTEAEESLEDVLEVSLNYR